jgi:putative glutamine amidotransferase
MRVTEAQNYTEQRNSIAYEYIDFFESLGFIIHLVPNNSDNIKKYFISTVDLLVLTGGNNINPNLYNNSCDLQDVYKKRDNAEKEMVVLALKNDIPILGICRGFHFLNIYFGGTLSHNIKNHVNEHHFINSNMPFLHNKETNSYHNQAIKTSDLAKNLTIFAKSEDDIVEGFMDIEKKVLAVQWHPERQRQSYDKKIILDFLERKL